MGLKQSKHILLPKVVRTGLIGGGVVVGVQLFMIWISALLVDKGYIDVKMMSVLASGIQIVSFFAGSVVACLRSKEKKLVSAVIAACVGVFVMLAVMILAFDGGLSGVGKAAVCIIVGCVFGVLVCMIPRNKNRTIKFRTR